MYTNGLYANENHSYLPTFSNLAFRKTMGLPPKIQHVNNPPAPQELSGPHRPTTGGHRCQPLSCKPCAYHSEHRLSTVDVGVRVW